METGGLGIMEHLLEENDIFKMIVMRILVKKISISIKTIKGILDLVKA